MHTRTALSSALAIAVSAWALLNAPSPASALPISIDLGGPLTGVGRDIFDPDPFEKGTLVGAHGGSFAQTFEGQTVEGGTGIIGTPSSPLTLKASGTLRLPVVLLLDGSSFKAIHSLDEAGPLLAGHGNRRGCGHHTFQ